jgi:phosphoglycolate phosphatase
LNVELLAVDLDGTLVDSAPDIAHCLGSALQAVGLPPPGEDRTRTLIGDGIETLIERALRGAGGTPAVEKRFEAALGAFTSCYASNIYVRSRLYPEAAATLDVLIARGIRLCCITNKRLVFAEAVLEQAGVRDRFELVLGGDSLPEKKPSPMQLQAAAEATSIAPSRAALVGDSYHDFHAARAAGFGFIWATYGYCRSLTGEGADKVQRIERFVDLNGLLAVPRGPAQG